LTNLADALVLGRGAGDLRRELSLGLDLVVYKARALANELGRCEAPNSPSVRLGVQVLEQPMWNAPGHRPERRVALDAAPNSRMATFRDVDRDERRI
jgi:hypothetical protein